MTQDELIERLGGIEKDIIAARLNAAIHGAAMLANEVKAEGVVGPSYASIAPAPAKARSPLADLPRGSKITFEIG